MTRIFTVFGPIVGKGRPRASRRGKTVRLRTPERTRQYEKAIRNRYYADYHAQPSLPGPIGVRLVAMFKRPQSHFRTLGGKPTEKLKSAAPVHCTKVPDLDNVVKVVLDALNGVAFKDDSNVTNITARKEWAPNGSTGDSVQVELFELGRGKS